MRFLCDACERLAPPAAFRVELNTLVLTCARCGAESRGKAEEVAAAALAEAAAAEPAPSTPPPPPRASMPALKVVSLRPSGEQVREAAELARSEDPFAVPPGFCPKCIAVRREDEPACASCGLIYACFVPAEHRASEPLRQAWLAVLSRWDDRDAHDRLLSLAMGRGELAQAGRLYRIRLAQAPEDLYAQRGRDEVVRLGLASASAALTPTQPSKGGKKLQYVVAFFLVLVLATAGFYVFRQFVETLSLR
jgi:hypothetical protein